MSETEPESEPDTAAAAEPEVPEEGPASRPGWYRRPPGWAWLIALVAIPLLLAVIGYGLTERNQPQTGEPAGALPTLTESPVPAAPPAVVLAPLSIVRSGDQITMDGAMPNMEAKRVLLDTVIGAVGQDVNIVDNVAINPDVKALDFSSAGPFFNAAAGIPDFGVVVGGDTVTLSGTAAVEADQDAVEDAATKAWPYVNIVDQIATANPPTLPSAPAPAPPGR